MSYSPSTMLDDNRIPPDPRYVGWDKRSRKELGERLYEAVDKRRDAAETLITRIMSEELHILGINAMMGMTDKSLLIYRVSAHNVITVTHEWIDRQIHEWKGLRWWRFDEKNVCNSWNKWYKKAKCWQDQNQYKPLGHFWSLIFDELIQYTSNITNNIFSNNSNYSNIVQKCLYSKCIAAILKGQVRFERTRETPLLPIRVLTQSKELQQKLNTINHGFTLSIWKQNAVRAHKTNTTKNRSNIATLLNQKCIKYATNIYQQNVQSLKQIIPTLNIDFVAIENDMNPPAAINKMDETEYIENYQYGPIHEGSSSILRVESQRYSPTMSSNSFSDTLSLTDGISIGSRNSTRSQRHHHNIYSMPRKPPTPIETNDNTSSRLDELSRENEELRRELVIMRQQLFNTQTANNDILKNVAMRMAEQNRFQILMTDKLLSSNNSYPSIPLNPPQHVPPPHVPQSHGLLHHYSSATDDSSIISINNPNNSSISASEMCLPEISPFTPPPSSYHHNTCNDCNNDTQSQYEQYNRYYNNPNQYESFTRE